MIDDILSLMNGISSSLGTYDSRRVDRNDVNGLTVSTCWSSDCGFETAILDEEGTHPVERYGSRDEAIAGHAKWCERAKTITEVVELGYGYYVEEELIQLVRGEVDADVG